MKDGRGRVPRFRLLGAKSERGSARLPLVALLVSGILVLLLCLIPWTVFESSGSPPSVVPVGSEVQPSELDGVAERGVMPRASAGQPVPAQLGSRSDARIAAHAAVVTGSLVLSEGGAATGVPLSLLSGPVGAMRAEGPADGGEWARDETTSDEQGRFHLEFLPSPGHEFELAISPPGLLPLRWRWTDLLPGERRDLGEIELEAAGRIVGRVLDGLGHPMTGHSWTVQALHPPPSALEGREPSEATCLSDVDSGEFILEGVPLGEVRLRAELSGTHGFEGPPVLVTSGEDAYVELTSPFPNMSTRIAVTVTCPPYGDIAKDLKAVYAKGKASVLTANRPNAETLCFTLENLSPGGYSIWIDDPRFVPWSMEGVEPGSLIEARLKGSARVRLSVRDRETGGPIERYSLGVQVDELIQPSRVVTVFESKSPGPGIVEGLLPTVQDLVIRSEGYADTHVRNLALIPGEERPVAVQLARGATISGRVSTPGMDDLVGPAIVRLVPKGAAMGRRIALLEDFQATRGVRSTPADETTGTYAFRAVASGSYLIQAARSPTVHSTTEEVEVTDLKSEYQVDLALPAESFLQGRLLGPPTTSWGGLHLLLVPNSFPGAQGGVVGSRAWRRRLRVPVEPDGSYLAGPLPTEIINVSLAVPDTSLPEGFHSRRTTGGVAIELGSVSLVPGRNEHDFDVNGRVPGTLRVKANLGEPAHSVVVQLCSVRANQLVTEAGATLGAERFCTIGPVRPDQFVLMIRSIDMSWYWIAPNLVEVVSGQARTADFDVPLAAGRVRLKSAGRTAAPPPGTATIRLESPHPLPGIFATPDAEGWVQLKLPPARYIVVFSPTHGGAQESTRFSMDWPPAPGAEFEVGIPETQK